jgi:predicted dinucleotide-binding enzyme
MGYKAFASMNIAIIGNGKTTAVLAQGLALAGHEILIGLKENEDVLFDFLVDEFENINFMDIEEAAAEADLVILASSPENVRESAYLLDDVRGKVIIDTSYMNTSSIGEYFNTLNAIKAITGSQNVVKCFNNGGFDPLSSKPGEIQMFLAGDSIKAKEMAKLLARDLGFGECNDFGGSDSVTLLDEMAMAYHNSHVNKMEMEKIPVPVRKN